MTRANNIRHMNLLVLGASGGVGRWLTRFAVEGGHEVTVVVRATTTFDGPSNVRVIRGDVLEPAVLASAVEGQNAVASCLGLRRASKHPWGALRSPPDFTTRLTRSLVPAMERAGIRRLVAISAGGVAESITQLSAPVRWLVSAGNVGVAYRDLAEMERLLSASRL